LQSEHTQLLDIILTKRKARLFRDSKDDLLEWVLMHDLLESTGMTVNAFSTVLVKNGVANSVDTCNKYLGNIVWAYDYDDSFGFSGSYNKARLTGEFTSMDEIRKMRASENAKTSKPKSKPKKKDTAETLAEKYTKGMSKKEMEALAIAILARAI